MKNIYKVAKEAVIVEELKAYSIRWVCQKGHVNHQTILWNDATQYDICLRCGEHYEYKINQ